MASYKHFVYFLAQFLQCRHKFYATVYTTFGRQIPDISIQDKGRRGNCFGSVSLKSFSASTDKSCQGKA
jgi:hypothetical protein